MRPRTASAGDGAFERFCVRNRILDDFWMTGDVQALLLWDRLCKIHLEDFPEDTLIEPPALPF